jgi:hypothetical protein
MIDFKRFWWIQTKFRNGTAKELPHWLRVGIQLKERHTIKFTSAP